MEGDDNNPELWRNFKTLTVFDLKSNENVSDPTKKKSSNLFSPSSLLIESLIEYICSLIEKNNTSQKHLYMTICRKLHELQLIDESYLVPDFDFIRNHYQRELYKLVVAAKAVSSANELITPVPAISSTNVSRSNFKLFEWSRYANEYYELEFIARGGFGEVVKVQNKLDTGIYAIKKICLKYRSINGFFRGLSEVQMLAKLNHPNIVSYKAAWLEPLLKEQKLSITKNAKAVLCVSENSTSQKDDSSDVIFVESELSKEKELICGISESSSESSPNTSPDHALDPRNAFVSDNYKKNSCNIQVMQFKKKTRRIIHECGQDWAVLFIQMQLCHQTLRQWLDQRNSICSTINIQESLRIFQQIVCGVEFIHSKGIVHHDIKPNNIFLDEDGKEVQVGDFGLSCCLLHDTRPKTSVTTAYSSSTCPVTVMHQPGEIGTKLYAAPEQLNGVCDYKSDLFSLGILLFELVFSFQTSMERIEKINNLRKGLLPSHLDEVSPDILIMIRQLVNQEVDTRPTAADLLKEVINLNRSMNAMNVNDFDTVTQLREEISHKNEEIKILKEKLLSLENSS